MTALQGFRVVELAEGVAGEYCGKLLSDFGAEVIKIERPGSGSPTRAMAPLTGEGVENSGLFAYLNTNKKSVALDIATGHGAALTAKLIAAADVVIDDHDAAWQGRFGLTSDEVEKKYPYVVFCAITPFGRNAPSEWANAKSLNVFHASGWGYHTPSAPDRSMPPLKGPGRFICDYESALDAALCIVASIYWRKRSGKGQSIDVSQLEVMVSRADCVVGRMIAGEVEVSEDRASYDMGGPHGIFRCKNGFVYVTLMNRQHWKGLGNLLGDPEWMKGFDENWLEFNATPDLVAECRARFAEWVSTADKDEISEKAQRLNVPLVPVNNAADLQRSPQFAYREFFQRLKHPALGEIVYPTVPYKLSVTPAKLMTPAPQLDAHRAEILAQQKFQTDG
jgi:crotonobetainyl-CoA:carnitine CoA-transferase CaiB-like acyl-CoA transferase